MKRSLLITLLLILLAACAPLETAPSPPAGEEITSGLQEPTQVPADPNQSPAEAGPAPTLPSNQQVPSQEQPGQPYSETQPQADPQIPGTAEIALLRPGQYSRLISPIRIIASFSNEEDKQTLISLFGEDERILAERKFDILPYDDPVNGNVITDLEFAIEEMNEVGRLEFKVYDQFGRLRALNSVNLILLSEEPAARNYAPEEGERIFQQIPFPGQTEIEGGKLFLSGLVQLTLTSNNGEPTPLTIHLVDEAGSIVGEGRASVVFTSGSLIGQYVAEIEYQVTGPTRVLLTIGIVEGRYQRPAYVKTFPLILKP